MPDRHGPYRRVRFLLEIDGVVKAGFSFCRLPASSSSVVEYREGNEPPTARKLVGRNEYGPLVLKSGATDDSIELFDWRRQVELGQLDEARRSIAVILLDEEGHPGPRWEFRNAWPSRYDAPTLDATRNGVAIETLEIVCEGYERTDDASETDGGSPQKTPDWTRPERDLGGRLKPTLGPRFDRSGDDGADERDGKGRRPSDEESKST